MRVVVVGGGVSGLTCAVALLEAGVEVLVKTAATPLGTVSAVAGAMLGPVVDIPGTPSTDWMRVGLKHFTGLAEDPATGVTIKRGRLLSAPELGTGVPPWASDVPGFAEIAADELPAGYPGGFRAALPFADMTRYLPWLVGRVGELGGRIEQDVVGSLPAAGEGADVVVNCSGLGSRRLAGDDSVHPIWGQHLIVEAPEIDEFTFEGGGSSPEGMGITPHPRGRVSRHPVPLRSGHSRSCRRSTAQGGGGAASRPGVRTAGSGDDGRRTRSARLRPWRQRRAVVLGLRRRRCCPGPGLNRAHCPNDKRRSRLISSFIR